MIPRLRLGVLAALATALFACAASATPTYYLFVNNLGYSSSSPLTKSDHHTSGATQLTTDAYALPGRLGLFVEARSSFTSLASDGSSGFAQAQESTNDFLITGPAGPTSVSGVFHFHAGVGLFLQGGYPGNNGQGVDAVVGVNAAGYTEGGHITYGNFSGSATGLFAGAGRSGDDLYFDVYGTFPVGTPFGVLMSLNASASTYGNSTCSPAIATTDFGTGFNGAGVQIGNITQQAMTLPAGYIVNSPSWGVVDNEVNSGPIAGIEPSATAGLELAAVSPNPSAGQTDFSFSLPREGAVDLAVLDLQGRRVRSMERGRLGAGPRRASWDGRDESGLPCAPGIYLALLRFEGETRVRRFARLR